MTQAISKARAVTWGISTIITPLAISLFAANVYVALWYMRMAMAFANSGPLA